jgi:predicted PurR-regulated permease PerM
VNSEPQRRFKFAPILTATVLTVLMLWLFKTVAQVLVLLMLGILISLYLGAVADWIQRRTRLPESVCLTTAILGSLGALAFLAFVLVPPVVEQTRQLIQDLPRFITAWAARTARSRRQQG